MPSNYASIKPNNCIILNQLWNISWIGILTLFLHLRVVHLTEHHWIWQWISFKSKSKSFVPLMLCKSSNKNKLNFLTIFLQFRVCTLNIFFEGTFHFWQLKFKFFEQVFYQQFGNALHLSVMSISVKCLFTSVSCRQPMTQNDYLTHLPIPTTTSRVFHILF